jgi:hypothetical protein
MSDSSEDSGADSLTDVRKGAKKEERSIGI